MPRPRPSPVPVDPPPSVPDLAADGALNVRDAAEWLGVSVKTLLRLVDRGDLRAVQIAGRRALLRADLRRYLRGLLEPQLER